MNKNILLGSHVSMSAPNYLLGSVSEAIGYNANTFMFYLGAPQNTKRVDANKLKITEFKASLIQNNIDIKNIVVHAPYIVNMANSNRERCEFANNFLIKEIEMINEIGCSLLVVHPGNYLMQTLDVALATAIDNFNFVISKTKNVIICLEFMSGKGTEICSNFDEIKTIISGIKDKTRVGVCLDTCHMNDSGINVSNIENILEEFDQKIGLNFLKVIHINDSMNDLGVHKDRHQNIGKGKIGLDSLKKWIHHPKLISIPKILETPYENNKPPYKEEINILLEV